MNIQDSQETNSFDSYNVHFKNKIACKQSNFEKKISHKTNVDVQQRLKRQKYSLLKTVIPKNVCWKYFDFFPCEYKLPNFAVLKQSNCGFKYCFR